MSKFNNDVSFGPAFDADDEYNESVPAKQQKALQRLEERLKQDLLKAFNTYMKSIVKLRDTQKAHACKVALDNRGYAIVIHHAASMYAKLLVQGDCSPAFCMAHFTDKIGEIVSQSCTAQPDIFSQLVKSVSDAIEATEIRQAAQKHSAGN